MRRRTTAERERERESNFDRDYANFIARPSAAALSQHFTRAAELEKARGFQKSRRLTNSVGVAYKLRFRVFGCLCWSRNY